VDTKTECAKELALAKEQAFPDASANAKEIKGKNGNLKVSDVTSFFFDGSRVKQLNADNCLGVMTMTLWV